MLLILFTLFPVALADIGVDYNCTSWSSQKGFTYDWQAVACENAIADSSCDVLYGFPFPEEGGNVNRGTACYTPLVGSQPYGIDVVSQASATNLCPKTCGYCCLTKAFNCRNKNVGINCATVTKAMCQYPPWLDILIDECPATCGYCQLKYQCVDLVSGCNTMTCSDPTKQDYVKVNCRKSCKICVEPETTPYPTFPTFSSSTSGSSTPRTFTRPLLVGV